MAILLPALAFPLLVVLIGTLATSRSEDSGGWERPFLLAAPLWGGVLVAILELLGSISAIRQGFLTLGWLLVDAGLAGAVLILVRRRGRQAIWRPARPRLTSGEWVFVAMLGSLLLGLLAVGLAAPSNNGDSLLYHMARIVHWAQNGSLRHYGTAYGHQLWNPPWAELAILDARVLWGNDRLSNLVQWGALVGVLVGVSSLGRGLGVDRRRRMLTVGFAASIPMAVLQATSTQNDLVTAFWLVVVAALILQVRKRALARIEIVSLGLAIGLGLLTKGTFYVFVVPFLVWFVATRSWKAKPRRALIEIVLVAGLAILPNLGHWERNLVAGGSPLGPREWVGAHSPLDPAALKPRVALLLPRVMRGLAQHFATPWPGVNAAIDSGVKQVFSAFGVVVNAPMVLWSWNHEDYAGNPLHLLLAAASVVALVLWWRRTPSRVFELAGCVSSAGLLMALFISPSMTTDGVRYHVPLFILWSPVFAAALGARLSPTASIAGASVFVVLSLPWLLFNSSRPAVGLRAERGRLSLPCSPAFGCTSVPSVFVADDAELLFARAQPLSTDLPVVLKRLQATSCRSVGLRIDSSDPEYAIWYLLDAPQSGFRMETIYTTPSLEPLLDRGFKPCAIVCTICGDRTRLHGLALAAESGPVKLFLGDGFTWDEDG